MKWIEMPNQAVCLFSEWFTPGSVFFFASRCLIATYLLKAQHEDHHSAMF